MKTPTGLLKLLGLAISACGVAAVASAQVPVTIMALGDSITEGYIAPSPISGGYRKELYSLLTNQGYAVDFVGTLNYPAAVPEGWVDGDHEAHSGFKIADIRSEAAFWFKQVPNPDVILLHIGTNDFWAGGTLATAQDHLTGLLVDISTLRPHARIIVSSLNPRTDSFEAIQDQFNDSIPGIVLAQAALGRKVTFVDMHDGFGTNPADFSSDGVHPSPSGYDKMATIWLPAITSVITPSGTTEPPAIASVDASADLTTITVTFSKPIKDIDGNNPANFSVTGVSVTAASLDASKRVVTLTTTSQTSGALYTLAVGGINDRMVPENLIPTGTTAIFLSQAIVDGSFEQGAAGWTATGNVTVLSSTTPEATDGQNLVAFSDADTPNTGRIAQTFTTIPGQKYRLQFDMGVFASNTIAQQLQLTVKDSAGGPSDQNLGDLTLLAMNGVGGTGNPQTRWQMRTFEFTAVSASSTIAFEDVSTETSAIDLLLDDVRLEAVVNDAPVAVDDGGIGNPFITVTQDSASSSPIAVLSNDSDLDNDPLTVIAAASPNGTVSISGGQTLSFTPTTGFVGNATISYTISDGQGGTDTAMVWIAVAAVGPFENGGFEDGSPVDGGIPLGWDVTGEVINYSSQGFFLTKPGNGNWMAVFNGGSETGSASLSQAFTTIIGQAYTVEFDAGLAAGQGNKTQIISAAVTGSLTPPGQTTTWPISSSAEPAEWAEPGKSFTFTAISTSTTLTFTVDISSQTPQTQFVDLLLDNVRVTPSGGGNQPPVAVDEGSVGAPFLTVDEDSTASGPIMVLANDSDPDLDPLTVTLATSSNGTVVINSGTTLSFTPTPNFNGATTISYTVSDGLGGTAVGTVFVDVTSVNDAPVAVLDTYAASFNTTLNVSLPGVLGNDTDDGPVALTAVVDSQPNNGGSLTLAGDGSFIYSPAPGFIGTESFTYHAFDGSLSSPVVSVTITVNSAGSFVNGSFEDGSVIFVAPKNWSATGVVTYADANNYTPAPGNGNWMAVFNPGNNETVSTLSQQFSTVVGREYAVTFDGGLAGGIGPKSQTLQAIVSGESNPPPTRSWTFESSVPAATSEAKNFTFVAGSASTTLTFTVDISGGGGAINVDLVLDDVKVTPIGGSNQTPVAVNDGSIGSPILTVLEDSGVPATIAVLANDLDGDLDPLTVTLASSPNGVVVINSGTTLSFTPVTNFNGTAALSYTVSDVLGGTSIATAFVAVTSVNDAPVAVDEGSVGSPFVTVVEDSGASAAISVLGNDSDVELNPLTVTSASSPNGTVGINSGTTLSYTPALDFHGATTISYTISDGQGGTSSATVFVAVTPVNDPPVAVADGSVESPLVIVAEDSGASSEISVLGNDTDVELDILTVTSAGSPNGGVVINSGTTLSFTPALDFHGATTISYTISDGQGGTSGATVFVAVTPVNDAPVAVNDGSVGSPFTTVAEDSGASLPIPVLGNDTDVDLDTLSVTSATSPGGSVVINTETTLAFTPAENFNGETTISYTISDGQGGTSTATVFVSVTPVNDAPVAVADGSVESPFVTVAEDSGASQPIAVLTNDADVDLDPLTITLATSPNGSVEINAGTTLSFTPAEDFNGPTTISYTVSDGQGGTASGTVHVVVTPVNDTPVAVADGSVESPFVTIAEDFGVSLPIAVLGNDTDVDPDVLNITLASSPDGAVVINDGATLSFTPVENFNGATTISYTISDGEGGTSSAIVFVAVTPVNDAPVAVADGSVESPFVTVLEDSGTSAPIAVLVNDTDVDLDPLTVTSATSPNGSVTVNSVTTLTFIPDDNFHGAATVSYSISDGQGGTASATVFIAVTPVNDAPVAMADGSIETPFITVDEDSGASAPILALTNDTDVDPDTLTITSAASPNGIVTINSGTSLTFTPADHFNGPTTISYTISDGQDGTASATVFVSVISINDVPLAMNDGSVEFPFVTVAEDSGASSPISVLGNDTDADFDMLAVTLASSPNGTVAISSVTNLSFTPAENFNGITTVSYTVSDGQGGTSSATAFVAVTPVNDAPVAMADGSAESPFLTVDEDSGASAPIMVLANDADVDLDTITITSAVSPNGIVAINSGTSLTFTPAEHFNGAATISYTISDGQDGTASATAFVAVTAINDLPLAVDDGSVEFPFVTVAEDSGASAPISVLGNDADADLNVLAITLANSPTGAVVINSGTTLTFTPAENFNGATTISYTISDGQGGSSSATVFVAVTPVNDPPVAAAGVATVNEDESVNINLVASDVDAGDVLTYEVVSDPANGSVVVAGAVATYTPNPNYHGSDSFAFRARDAGLLGSAETVISITVTSVDDAPVANEQSVSLDEDGSLAITLTGSDDGASSLTYAVLGGPSHGSLRLNGAVATYTPDPDFNGQDSFYFIALTFSGGPPVSVLATVSITVNPVNDAPTAIAQTVSLNEDGTLEITLTGSDPDLSDALLFTPGAAAHGTLTQDGAVVTYSPDPNYNGPDGFTFTVSDGTLVSPPAAVSIAVSSVNDAPVAVNDGSLETPVLTIAEDSGILTPVAVLGNDSDVDLDPLTVTLVDSPNGLAAVNPDGTLAFTPAPDFNGTAVISYTISDWQGATAVGTVFVAVTPVNDMPVALDDGSAETPFVTMDEDSVSAPFGVLANDTDVDVDTLTVTSASSPNGVVAVSSGTTLTFTPASDFNGATTISYSISDGQGGSSGATAFVKVTPVNDPPVAIGATTTVNEDGSVQITLTGSDMDAGEVLAFSKATDPAHGSVTVVDGVATYMPNPNFNGSDSFTFIANDGEGDSLPATVSITVTPVDDVPVASAQSISVNEDGSVVITLTGGDVDGDSLSFTVATPPVNGDVTLSGAMATYTPDPNYFGTDTFDFYVVTLPTGTPVFSVPATVSITVTPVSDMPVAVDDGSVASPFVTVAEDSGASAPIAVLANDSDVDLDPLTVTLANSPNGLVAVNPDNTLTFSPALDFNGATTISYTISDGNGGTSGATVYLTLSPVNDAPVAIAQAVSLDEEGSLAITLSGSDPDGDVTAEDLNYVVTINPLHGTLGVSGRNLIYTPDANFTGTDSITFKVNDGATDSTTAVVSIMVNPVNDPPTAVAGTATVNEDGSINITLTGSDVDAGEVLTFSKVTDPLNGSVSVANGIVTYIPNPNFNGSDSFTFRANDGDVDSTPATVSITVTPVDDPPVANAQMVSVNEDGNLMVTLTGSDVDGDTLFFTIPVKPPHGNVILSGAVATYTPDPNYNGPDSISFFVYTIISGTPVFSPSSTISITVNPVNDMPVAVNDGSIGSPFVTVTEDSGASAPIAVLGNDTDIDLTPLTVTLASSPNGMVTINDGTTLSFTPAENYNGATTIDYTISDGQGGTASATVFVAVTPVNDVPLAVDDGSVESPFVTVEEDSGDSPAIVVLANDSDLELNPLTVTQANSPNGTVTINDGTTLNFNPTENFNGATTIEYTISDGQGGLASATVFVAVTPVNDPPVAFAQSISVNENTPVNVTLTGSDIDGDTLIFAAGSAAHGTVSLSGSVATYTPAANYSGPDSFTFAVADGSAVSAPATVSITVIDVGGPAFEEWLTQYSLTADPGTDSDNDSISNAVEYVIGGNPAAQPDTDLLPTAELMSADLDGNPGDEDYLLFTYLRTDLANDDPLTTIQVEWSTDLAGPWLATSGMVEQVTDGAGVDTVKVHIPRTLASGGRIFARLGVEIVTVPAPE